MLPYLFRVLQQLDQVLERLDPVQFRRMDQTHERVPGPGSCDRPVEQRVLSVHDRPLQRGLAEVVVQGRPRLSEEQRQFGPVLSHVGDGLAQPGVGLDLPTLDLVPEPDLQARHDGPAPFLVAGQPGLGVHSLPLGLGIGPIDLSKLQQQVLDLGGEPVLHFHESAAGMSQAVSQDGVQFPGLAHRVGREGIAHLDGGREVLGPVLQHSFQVLPGVVVAGDE